MRFLKYPSVKQSNTSVANVLIFMTVAGVLGAGCSTEQRTGTNAGGNGGTLNLNCPTDLYPALLTSLTLPQNTCTPSPQEQNLMLYTYCQIIASYIVTFTLTYDSAVTCISSAVATSAWHPAPDSGICTDLNTTQAYIATNPICAVFRP